MKTLKRKYPRTAHVPFSPGATNDDRMHEDISFFNGKEIVISEKMDGESCTIMNDCIYARSMDSVDHPSRHWVKGLWGKMGYQIPDDWKVCGENLFATHSLHYKNLSTYFLVFSIWDEDDTCLSWDDTVTFSEYLGLQHVPVLWRGIYNKEFIEKFKIDPEFQEGFVIRLASSFSFDEFEISMAKWVRADHISSPDSHWMFKPVVPNELKK